MKRLMMLLTATGMMVMTQTAVFGALEGTVFQLVDDFQTQTGNIDGKSCGGVLGGMWDTESENTGNMKVQGTPNVYMVAQAKSSAAKRGVGFSGITKPIDNTQTGVAFFRFEVSTAAYEIQSYLGLHSLTGSDFVNGTTCVPASINAGFELYRSGTTGNYAIRTTDGTSTLKSNLITGKWYNAWIVANNAADTFDLYVKAVTAPGGSAELPTDADKIGTALSFSTASVSDLTGFMLCQRPTLPQVAEIHLDDMYWAVPEPATLILLGLGGLAMIRKK